VPESQAVFATVPVALLYQGGNLGGHLKDALRDLGADIVYESLASDLDRDALEGCGARIVVFNLDSESDAQIDHVTTCSMKATMKSCSTMPMPPRNCPERTRRAGRVIWPQKS
jgi:hypothetical protein